MSDYYTAQKVRGLYEKNASEPFKISRSKIDLFIECPRCFYFDRRVGISRPPGFPFSLNSAVDALLKKEFDIHRAKETRHSTAAQAAGIAKKARVKKLFITHVSTRHQKEIETLEKEAQAVFPNSKIAKDLETVEL